MQWDLQNGKKPVTNNDRFSLVKLKKAYVYITYAFLLFFKD